MEIRYRTDLPDSRQYWELFLTTGWNEKYQATPADLMRSLENSWLVICAYDGERLVSFGRVVSDMGLHAMIYDMITQPEYQGRGIGSYILEYLVKRCQQAGIRDIQLFCARGKRPWYEKRGFAARPDEAPGMQFQENLR